MTLKLLGMGSERPRAGDFEPELIGYESAQHLELWVRCAGLLERFCVYLGGTLVQGLDDGRIHVFPIERQPDVSVIVVRFTAPRGGVTSIVDVSGPARKIQQRDDHSYLLRAV